MPKYLVLILFFAWSNCSKRAASFWRLQINNWSVTRLQFSSSPGRGIDAMGIAVAVVRVEGQEVFTLQKSGFCFLKSQPKERKDFSGTNFVESLGILGVALGAVATVVWTFLGGGSNFVGLVFFLRKGSEGAGGRPQKEGKGVNLAACSGLQMITGSGGATTRTFSGGGLLFSKFLLVLFSKAFKGNLFGGAAKGFFVFFRSLLCLKGFLGEIRSVLRLPVEVFLEELKIKGALSEIIR